LCRREIDPEEDKRFVVRIEVFEAVETVDMQDFNDAEDHLEELEEILEELNAAELKELGSDFYRKFHFDLCSECRKKFVRNPLGIEAVKLLDFSDN